MPVTGLLILLAGCASPHDSGLLIDPLKQRLIAREDIALQNLLLARMPAPYSYLDAPYDGPAVEPPLPDLNLLPEDLPPWEEVAEPPEATPQPTPPEPVPMEAGNETTSPSES